MGDGEVTFQEKERGKVLWKSLMETSLDDVTIMNKNRGREEKQIIRLGIINENMEAESIQVYYRFLHRGF